MTRKDWDRAYLEGITARQNGKKAESNPYRNKPTLRPLADSWMNGWNLEDRKIRGQR